MTTRLIVLSLILACVPLQAADDAFNPFSAIVRRGDVILVTLSPHHRWAVAEGYGSSREALEGETFRIRDGEWLFLAELEGRRLIYRLRGHLSSLPAGVRVEQRFDARTFTNMRVKKAYFLEAR